MLTQLDPILTIFALQLSGLQRTRVLNPKVYSHVQDAAEYSPHHLPLMNGCFSAAETSSRFSGSRVSTRSSRSLKLASRALSSEPLALPWRRAPRSLPFRLVMMRLMLCKEKESGDLLRSLDYRCTRFSQETQPTRPTLLRNQEGRNEALCTLKATEDPRRRT